MTEQLLTGKCGANAVFLQFYLVFPMLVILGHGSSVAASCPYHKSLKRSMLLLGTVFAGSLSLSARQSFSDSNETNMIAFYMMPSRLWQLAAGGLLKEASVSFPECWDSLLNCKYAIWVLESASVFSLAFSLVFSKPRPFPVPFALPATVGTILLIITGASPHCHVAGLFALDWPVCIGKLSYTIYLFHWPILVVLKWNLGVLSLPVMALAICTTLGLSMFAYHVLEKHVRDWKPTRLVFLAVFLVSIVLVFAWLRLLSGPLSGALYYKGVHKAPKSAIVPGNLHCACKSSGTYHQPRNATIKDIGFGPCFETATVPYTSAGATEACHFELQVPSASAVAACVSRSSTDQEVIFLIGDSHAGHLGIGLRAAVRGVISVRLLSMSANIGWDAMSATAMSSTKLMENYAATMATVYHNMKAGDIISFSFAYSLMGLRNFRFLLLFLQGAVATATSSNVSVILFGDVPHMPAAHLGLKCLIPGHQKECTVAFESARLPGSPIKQYASELATIVQYQAKAHYFDIFELFCDNISCSQFVPGTTTLATYDNSHLSVEGSLYLWPYICDFLSSYRLLPVSIPDA